MGEKAVALRRGGEVHIVSAAGAVQGVQLPAEDPGDLLAASVDGTGTVSMLFVNKVNPAGRPLYGLTLGRVGPIDLSKQNSKETMPLTTSWRLFGSTPPLSASIAGNDGTEALILSNGKFNFERPSLGAEDASEEQRRDDVDELDEELGEILRRQGLQLPKSQGASAVVTLASSACEHYHLSLPAVTCRAHVLLPPGVSMAVVLRTAQGHGAICQCWVEPQADPSNGASRIKVRHCATFPGLAVLCATPGMAYLSLDALDAGTWAALGKWRSGEAVEVFRLPKGRGSSSTQGLQLDGLQGLQLLGNQLFVWHSRGLLRYNLPRGESWCPASQESEIPGPDDHDEWGQAPCADLSDLENAWQQSS